MPRKQPKVSKDRIIEINKIAKSSAHACRILGLTPPTYYKYCKIYELEPVVNRKHMPGMIASNRITKAQLISANNQCKTGAAVERMLGISYLTYRALCERYGVERIVNKGAKGLVRPNSGSERYSVDKILNGEFPSMPLWRVMRRLVANGLKTHECEKCGFNEPRIDGKYPLLMFFRERTHTKDEWKIENLGILCYNCFFLTMGKAQNKNLSDERTKHT